LLVIYILRAAAYSIANTCLEEPYHVTHTSPGYIIRTVTSIRVYMMAVTNGDNYEFTLKNETLENLRPLRVVVVGAGYSGIYAAIRFEIS